MVTFQYEVTIKRSQILVTLAALALGAALGWILGQNSSPNADTSPRLAAESPSPRASSSDPDRALRALLEQLTEDLARKDAEIEALRLANQQLEKQQQTLESEVDQLNQEWVFSYGSTREAGKFIGSLLRDAMAIRGMDNDDPARAALARDIFLKFSSLGPILQEMQNLDDNPREFAVFRAAAIGEAVGMDSASQARLQSIVETYKAQALPYETGSEARTALNERAAQEIRNALTEEQAQRIEAIPGARRGLFNDPLETPAIDPRMWSRGRGR